MANRAAPTAPLTSLVGRKRELTEVRRLLQRGRLVTATDSGWLTAGVGRAGNRTHHRRPRGR